MRLPRLRLTRRRVVPALVVLVIIAGLVAWAAWPRPRSWEQVDQMIPVADGPDGAQSVTLDTSLFLPKQASATHPVPAILLAHGFGGTKDSVTSDAESFAEHGYAVLTWTAQGFGRSTGSIHLDSPDYEVRDASGLLDWLAARDDIELNAPGDPKVGVIGGSYGGGLALLLAAFDHRVDAIVPMITWNDLANAFLPNGTGAGPAQGVFKKQWAGLFFGSGNAAFDPQALLAQVTGGGADPSAVLAQLAATDPQCGRFAADVCAAYLDLATDGVADQSTLDLLHASSPATFTSNIVAPTLLVQGQADSLFPLTEGEANYRQIAAIGTPVRMDWFTGGHDGGNGTRADQDRIRAESLAWLDHYVRGSGPTPTTDFTYSRVSGIDAQTRGITTSGFTSDRRPDATGGSVTTVDLAGPPQRIANPPDGNPAAISIVPGGGLASALAGTTIEIPGQNANFLSAPLATSLDVVGTPTVRVAAASPTGTAVLFVKLYDVDPQGSSELPFGLAAPVRLSGLPASIDTATPVTVTLPAIVHRFEAGHRLRVVLATSDQAYTSPVEPAVYTVGLSDGAVTLPTLAGTPLADPALAWRWALLGVVVALIGIVVAALLVGRARRHRHTVSTVDEPAQTPLVVRGLRKEYADGFVAVAQVDFTVERGQVVGLLGPNGAGKTTSLRVLMGLTQPTAGSIHIFGQELRPGADVLRRVGALVEGPGFLPHLSGRRNLELYWRATGRPRTEAHVEEALEIAGLGGAVNRRVKKYSHGMRQRLAIAQAMLGLPELLVLDEPTDGLDPPQIAQMRRMLRAYATDGRAVLVSSHLLAEVEQTCTHVVVMSKGRVVADGPVGEIVGDSPVSQFDVSDVERASTALAGLPGVSVTGTEAGSLVVDTGTTPRAQVVATLVEAGVGVDRVTPRRRLEDAFLTLVGGDSKASGERE